MNIYVLFFVKIMKIDCYKYCDIEYLYGDVVVVK